MNDRALAAVCSSGYDECRWTRFPAKSWKARARCLTLLKRVANQSSALAPLISYWLTTDQCSVVQYKLKGYRIENKL